jgi:hypothetical protein
MLEVSGEPDLRLEALNTDREGDLRFQYLDGNVATVFQIVRKINDRHASGAQLAHEPIARGQSFGQLDREFTHAVTGV